MKFQENFSKEHEHSNTEGVTVKILAMTFMFIFYPENG